MVKKIFLFALFLCIGLAMKAQKMTESDHIRRGNRHYTDSLFEKAEIEYRKALELNPQSIDAMYNLGNALFCQVSQLQESAGEKAQEAMQQYATAAKLETDKEKLAKIYHNMGTLTYMAQQYSQSVESYKESLRNNPTDNETRYNLAKAMHMLKQQQNQEQQQNQDQQDQQQNQQQNQEQQEQNQEQNKQQDEQQQNQQEEQQEQQQQEDQQKEQQKDTPQQAQQEKEQISKENAEQMLNAVMQDEKDIQEKVKKMQQQKGKTLEKDW